MTTPQEQKKFINSFYKVSAIRLLPQSDRTKQIYNLIDMKYINKSLLTIIKKDIFFISFLNSEYDIIILHGSLVSCGRSCKSVINIIFT